MNQNLDKEFIVSKINHLIEAHKLWEELSGIVHSLGGELWETKYVEAYYFHEATVYDLILAHRGFPSLEEDEFEYFRDIIYDLAHNDRVELYEVNSNGPSAVITTAEELYNWMVNTQELFVPHLDNLN